MKHTMQVPDDVWTMAQTMSGNRNPASYLREYVLTDWLVETELERHSQATNGIPGQMEIAMPDGFSLIGILRNPSLGKRCAWPGCQKTINEPPAPWVNTPAGKRIVHIHHIPFQLLENARWITGHWIDGQPTSDS